MIRGRDGCVCDWSSEGCLRDWTSKIDILDIMCDLVCKEHRDGTIECHGVIELILEHIQVEETIRIRHCITSATTPAIASSSPSM